MSASFRPVFGKPSFARPRASQSLSPRTPAIITSLAALIPSCSTWNERQQKLSTSSPKEPKREVPPQCPHFPRPVGCRAVRTPFLFACPFSDGGVPPLYAGRSLAPPHGRRVARNRQP